MSTLECWIIGVLLLAIAVLASVMWQLSKKEREQWRRLNEAIQDRRWNDKSVDGWIIALALSAAMLAPWSHMEEAVDDVIAAMSRQRNGQR